MIILYVPFSFEEFMVDLFGKTEQWKRYYNYYPPKDKYKDNEIIVLYHNSITTYPDRFLKIKKALKEGDAQIYILSHGIETKELAVSNIENIEDIDEEKIITIDEVANRFHEDFLDKINFNPKNEIKLYFCDAYMLDKKAKIMAIQFQKCLENDIPNLPIQYYSSASVATPSKAGPEFTPALFTNTNQKGAKKATKDIYVDCLNGSLKIKLTLVGNSSLFKHELHKKKSAHALMVHQEPLDTYISKLNPIYQDVAMEILHAIKNQWHFSSQLKNHKNAITKEIIQSVFYVLDEVFKNANLIMNEMESTHAMNMGKEKENAGSSELLFNNGNRNGISIQMSIKKESFKLLMDSISERNNLRI